MCSKTYIRWSQSLLSENYFSFLLFVYSKERRRYEIIFAILINNLFTVECFFFFDLEGIDTINRQAVLCHRVLRTLKQIANDSKILDRETWECLLLFLIAINDNLLALPTVKDDIADQLCERTLSVLFEVMKKQ